MLFCCHFIVSACHTFSSVLSDAAASLEKVAQLAQLILRLAVDEERVPYKEASHILKRVKVLQESLTSEMTTGNIVLANEMNTHAGDSGNDIPHGQGMNDLNDHELANLGLFWDFSSLFPTGFPADMDHSSL